MAGSKAGMRRVTRLSAADRELVEAARAVRRRAYAPYSRFTVGAALRTVTGEIYTGCNVENASFGLTVCAERHAIAAAVAAGDRAYQAIAIASGSSPPAPPCGACRQVLSEFAPEISVLLVGPRGPALRGSLSRLLPHRFSGLGGKTRR
jgi:cytidine deaminase